MRLTVVVLSNYFKRYVERELHKGRLRQMWHPLTGWKEIKKKKFHYNEHRPWTDEFKMSNRMDVQPPRIYVQPIKTWNMFKGDRVEVLVGQDKGKQGTINCIIKERNWVYVEGLNNKYTMESQSGMSPMCIRREQPLLVTTQVKLVDPSTNKGTDIEWRYTETGGQVRVAIETNRIIPLPEGAQMLDDFVIPKFYVEGDKDTKEKELTKVTFQPKLCAFEEEIMDSLSIKEDRKPRKTYWY